MRLFNAKNTFSGLREEDFDSTITVYKTKKSMCRVKINEKLNGIPVRLSGDALINYSSNVQGCSSYDEAVPVLRNWYNISDKRPRFLTERQ